MEDEYLAWFFGRTPNAVRIMAHRLGLSKRSVQYRLGLKLTQEEEQVIVGGLLGDLHSRVTKTAKNPRLEGGHGFKQREYMLWKVSLLKRLKWWIYKTKINTYSYQSKNFPALWKYQNLFYPNGEKIITRETLDLLDDFGVLIWYLDDGSYVKKDKSCRFHTNGFSANEQKEILWWFNEKYSINPRIHTQRDSKNYPGKKWEYIYISRKDTKKLFKSLEKFEIPDCMRYKFGRNLSHSTNFHEQEAMAPKIG